MPLKKHVPLTIAFTIFLILFTTTFQMVFAQETAEETSIKNATESINQAFNSLLEAEKAGANTTQLLIRLNTAGQLLADVQNTYQTGNTQGVVSKANSAKQLAEQVNTEAITLKAASLTLAQNSFWFTITFSIGGAIVFGVVMLIIWQRFKRSYTKKFLSLKPEVVNDAP